MKSSHFSHETFYRIMKNMFLDQTLTSPWTVWQSKRNFSPISFFFFRSLRVCKNFYEKIDVEGGNWLPPALSHKKYESSGYDTVIFNGISSIFSLHSMDLCADRCRYTIRSSKSTGFCARVFIQVKTFFFREYTWRQFSLHFSRSDDSPRILGIFDDFENHD